MNKKHWLFFACITNVFFFSTAYLSLNYINSNLLLHKTTPLIDKKIALYHSLLFDTRDSMLQLVDLYYKREISIQELTANQYLYNLRGLFEFRDNLPIALTSLQVLPEMPTEFMSKDRVIWTAATNKGFHFSHVFSVNTGTQHSPHIGRYAYRLQTFKDITKRLGIDLTIVQRTKTGAFSVVLSTLPTNVSHELSQFLNGVQQDIFFKDNLYAHKWLKPLDWPQSHSTSTVLPVALNTLAGHEQFVLYSRDVSEKRDITQTKYLVFGVFVLSILMSILAYCFSPQTTAIKII